VHSDFCIDAVNALDEESCYVLPGAPTRELLLYLHGTVPPAKVSPQKTNFETVVANAARRAGVAALLPRGRRGLAPRGQDNWWGWPTSTAAYVRLGPELVQAFAEKRRKLEALTGTRFSKLYLAGSSSGAYFAAALALDGAIDAAGFAAIAGGGLGARSVLRTLPPKPFYIGYGRDDSAGRSAALLGQRLTEAGWPVQVAVHPLPHGTNEIYLDEAFEFWRRHVE
jgi:predicted esterase